MHRVRLLLPYLREHGVAPTVLCVHADTVACPQDPWMAEGLPLNVPVHRVPALGLGWSRIPGLGTLSYRARERLRRAGTQLLRSREFDAVYFSTTQFGIHTLGPYWKRRFGVPFFMDYQDPWVSDYYVTHPTVTPPGGRLKYGISRFLATCTEPRVLRACSGITSVSPAYPRQLADRYGSLVKHLPVLVAPFPGDRRDFLRVASDEAIRQEVFDPHDGMLHWVYVGRGGHDMHRALRAIFSAVRIERLRHPAEIDRLRMHFIGTSYAAVGQGEKTIEPLALKCGVSDLVHEVTDRIPYSQSLRCLLDAQALIVPGSDDPAYTASKIYPYLLARRPLLAIFHEQSSVVDLMRLVGGGTMVTFRQSNNANLLADDVRHAWFDLQFHKQVVALEDEAFEPFTAEGQAKRIAKFFTDALKEAMAVAVHDRNHAHV